MLNFFKNFLRRKHLQNARHVSSARRAPKEDLVFFHLSIDEPSFVEIVVIVVVCLLDESLSRPIGALEARDEMATRKQRARSRIRIAYDARRSLLQFFDVIL